MLQGKADSFQRSSKAAIWVVWAIFGWAQVSPSHGMGTFNLLNFWRLRKPLQAAWSRVIFWAISLSRSFSSLDMTPGFRNT